MSTTQTDSTISSEQTHNHEMVANDPLLACLSILCLHEKRSFSPKAVISGLPLEDHKLTPTLFQRAAERTGFKTKLMTRKLNKIHQLVLPAVLVLKERQACVLLTVNREEGTAEIKRPNAINNESEILSLEDLNAQYTNRCILVQVEHTIENRAKQFEKSRQKSWFWGTLWRFRKIYFQATLAAVMVNLFTLAGPLFIMNVYDRVVPNNAIHTLWVLAIGVMIVFIFDFVVRSMRGYLLDVAGQKVDVLLASDLFQQVLGMKLSGKPSSAGAFANNLREFDSLREFFTSATLTSLVDVPFLLLFIWIISMIGGSLALIPLLAAPVVILAAYFLEAPLRKAIEEAKVSSTQKHAMLVESITGLETIKAISAEGVVQKKWEHFVCISAKAGLKSRFFSSIATNFTLFIQQLVTVVMVIVGVYLISVGSLSMGGLIACVILAGRGLAPLGQITNLLTRLERSKMALSGLNQVMTLPLERPKKQTFLHRPKIEGDIEFDDVSFNYPFQPVPALNKVSLRIRAGEKVAVVGRIGAGKSTIQRLVLGLYAPSSGSIRIDGTDIAQIDPAELRSNIGYAAQDSLLFYGTVRDNIVMRDFHVDDERILEVAKLTGVHNFVSKHPSGYDMQVGERGEGLSGGQRQAIGMARALLAKTPILLFDEPTAAIDHHSEKEFVKSLREYLTNETLIIATHRGAMLDLVDRIIIIEDGKIIADDTKAKVMQSLKQEPIAHVS